jgi:hypothetical protein
MTETWNQAGDLGARDSGNFIHHGGYAINVSAIADSPDFPDLLQSVKRQLDIVASTIVRSDILQFFRGLPIVITPGIGMYGRYSQSQVVEVGAIPQPPDKPILLHEFLHAFHVRILPEGLSNPEILTFYERAKAHQMYPPDASVLQSPAEFFALTASAFLHGKIARPPFTRENLKAKQPKYYQYLAGLLGAPDMTPANSSEWS